MKNLELQKVKEQIKGKQLQALNQLVGEKAYPLQNGFLEINGVVLCFGEVTISFHTPYDNGEIIMDSTYTISENGKLTELKKEF